MKTLKSLSSLADCNIAILVKVLANMVYSKEDNRPVDTNGTKYVIVCPLDDFNQYTVKIVTDNHPIITNEELQERLANFEFTYCIFDGFAAKNYVNSFTGKAAFTCSAKSIRLLTEEEVKTLLSSSI